eukprot:scaffold40712_cov65-Phaeocystis_antarctica.AAC.2
MPLSIGQERSGSARASMGHMHAPKGAVDEGKIESGAAKLRLHSPAFRCRLAGVQSARSMKQPSGSSNCDGMPSCVAKSSLASVSYVSAPCARFTGRRLPRGCCCSFSHFSSGASTWLSHCLGGRASLREHRRSLPASRGLLYRLLLMSSSISTPSVSTSPHGLVESRHVEGRLAHVTPASWSWKHSEAPASDEQSLKSE